MLSHIPRRWTQALHSHIHAYTPRCLQNIQNLSVFISNKIQEYYNKTQLKGNASEWFTRNVECPDRPIRDWSLESVIKGLQKQFLNSLTHRQASNKFDTIKQGQRTVQELIQELTNTLHEWCSIQMTICSEGCTKTIFAKRGTTQRYHCGIQ